MSRFDQMLKEAGIPRSNGFEFYFKNYIFKNINLNNKKILDIGGGNGIASFYALSASPNCKAWVVDPIVEGSNTLMINQFNNLSKNFDSNQIYFHKDFINTLQEPKEFDIVVMHNSINHIGEDIIKDVKTNHKSYDKYINRIKEILERLSKKGILIITDCGRRNFFGDLGFKNPLAPSIEWETHCEPDLWRTMIERIGLYHIKTEWTSRREFGYFGKILFANRLCSFFLNSHFKSIYIKS